MFIIIVAVLFFIANQDDIARVRVKILHFSAGVSGEQNRIKVKEKENKAPTELKNPSYSMVDSFFCDLGVFWTSEAFSRLNPATRQSR
jgi:hypothetical protein